MFYGVAWHIDGGRSGVVKVVTMILKKGNFLLYCFDFSYIVGLFSWINL